MVAPPQVGTPSAVAALLHGYEQGQLMGLTLKTSVARELGENMPGAYGLLPSEKYFEKVQDPVIIFDPSVDKVANFREFYGDTIDTFGEEKNFVTAVLDGRTKPEISNIDTPNVLKQNILDKAIVAHDTIDNIVFPANIKVSQIAGWGFDTVKNVEYSSKNECSFFNLICKKKKVLSVKFNPTSDGDKTVVTPSAIYEDETNYYLNLLEYNDKYLDKNHANIFEIPAVFDLVKNILKDDTTLPEYVVKEKPEAPDNLVLLVKSPVSIDVYDEFGNHTGTVENNESDLNATAEDIPNSVYWLAGDNKEVILPKEGNYTIKLSGLEDGIFTFEIETLLGDVPSGIVSFIDIPTSPTMKAEIKYDTILGLSEMSIDKDGDDIFEDTISPSDPNAPEIIEENPPKENPEENLPPIIVTKNYGRAYIPPSSNENLNINDQTNNPVLPLENKENKEIKEKIIETIQPIIKGDKTVLTQELEKIKEPENNNLLASAGSALPNSRRIAIQGAIVAGVLLLLFCLKFIFKVK
jgi:hypothetical protein